MQNLTAPNVLQTGDKVGKQDEHLNRVITKHYPELLVALQSKLLNKAHCGQFTWDDNE